MKLSHASSSSNSTPVASDGSVGEEGVGVRDGEDGVGVRDSEVGDGEDGVGVRDDEGDD